MSNLVAPLTPIDLDKPRNIRVDFNALATIEEKTGKNTLKGETWKELTATNMRVFLWACLLHEDPDLTLEAVGAMLHPGNAREVGDQLMAAFLKAAPPVAEGRPKNRKLPTG